ncbi:MAG: alpha-L-fucosidase [Nibricoccus sp.]
MKFSSFSRYFTLLAIVAVWSGSRLFAGSISIDEKPTQIVSTRTEEVAAGPFEPTWKSLAGYQVPEWFRDAKFGIWAHWGPQCQPEAGDWYARDMYSQGHRVNKLHVERYGHPSEFGFKDVIHLWKAERWDPENLVAFYKRVGARYFFAMANHHDNLDLWASRHQVWNSVNVGPQKNIIAGWAAAAHAQGLPFGVSVHAAHAWSWYEVAQGADLQGPKAGVPYDGKLTAADVKGTWCERFDPQKLYAQNHVPSPGFEALNSIHNRWNWDNGCSQPDLAYCQKFYDRTVDLINQAQPDLLYFDDTALPLWPVSDAGLKIAAHFYNHHIGQKGAADAGVLFGKILNDEQRKCLLWDIERGVPATILPYPWQTDTCLGNWHYDRALYERDGYKSARTVIHMLADVVSKNGNLLLNVPVRGDGSIDEKEITILEKIRAWMDVNHEAIYATRPWKVFGEGPASEGVALSAQGFNEGKGKPFTAADVRYTTSKDGRTLYIIVLGSPTEPLVLSTLGRASADVQIKGITVLGGRSDVRWEQKEDALTIEAVTEQPGGDAAVVLKVAVAVTR